MKPGWKSRSSKSFRPGCDPLEERLALSAVAYHPGPGLPEGFTSTTFFHQVLQNPPGFPPVRPNTPVVPYGAGPNTASFVDVTTHVFNGQHVIISSLVYVAPFATLDARNGYVKVGSGSTIGDNSKILANPNHDKIPTIVFIGNSTVVGPGATIEGPSTIGSYQQNSAPVSIGANALIDGATIDPGAIVGPLARVGPGVTVPSGMYVLPGVNVTTNAEASNPKLGFVRAVTSTELSNIKTQISDDIQLAAGYANLYQGNTATGASPAFSPTISYVNYGYLPAVSGSSAEPGAKFEPGVKIPMFLSTFKGLQPGAVSTFRARVIGQVTFIAHATQVAYRLGPSNSIRADQGQPILFASAPRTGRGVSIQSPVQGVLKIGHNLIADTGAVILGGPRTSASNVSQIGDNVTIGADAVIDRSTIGAGALIGPRSVVQKSFVPPGDVIPAGTIMIDGKVVGHIQW